MSTIRIIQCTKDELESGDFNKTFTGDLISVRNELATYAALKKLIAARMRNDEAEKDRADLEEMLSQKRSPSDRKFMALIIKEEERELLRQTISLISSWELKCENEMENYVLPEKEGIREQLIEKVIPSDM